MPRGRPLLRRLRLPFRHECMMVPHGGSNAGYHLTKAVERLRPFTVVLVGGLEPPASRLQGECSAR